MSFSLTIFSILFLTCMGLLGVLALRLARKVRQQQRDLGGLSELESLNVFGTEITPAALKAAEHLPKLQHLYAGETKITANGPLPDALKGKVLF